MAVSGNRKWNSADESRPVTKTAAVKSREPRLDLTGQTGQRGSWRAYGQVEGLDGPDGAVCKPTHTPFPFSQSTPLFVLSKTHYPSPDILCNTGLVNVVHRV